MNTIIRNLLKDVVVPKFVRVKQTFDENHIPSDKIAKTVFEILSQKEVGQSLRPNMRVCLTCGSRGIDNIAEILRAVATFCKKHGAEPFAIPAMGSHGGATAEGQLEVLHSFGITEETIGCPIISSMETDCIGETEEGHPVFIDRNAARSDGIIVINRIKPHTSFRGSYESGLMKMMAIGLGKQKGAEVCHAAGFPMMHHMVPLFGNAILKHAPILCGVGILENAFDRTAHIEALLPEEFVEREPELLEKAFAFMPSIGIADCDVLVIDEIGKNISGCGMDPNISGVFATPGMTGGIKAQRRCILSLTEETHGNGYGMGAADAISERFYRELDLDKVYPNTITSTSLTFSKIPIIMDNDLNTIRLCIRTCNEKHAEGLRIVRIRNTLSLSEFEVSEALIPMVKQKPNMEIISESYELPFDRNGNLL
ncbi:MAG: DUF2088 domain-containing protein [Ruminococcaceae bacterium]|nr:DUF2088 domain-containing protein [Oscillospiraceae bacterium]